jgi:hypothetical protein
MSQIRVNSIANIGGVEAISILSSGTTVSKNPITFSATRTAGNISGPATVVWNSVKNNVGNAYNSSTGIFTAPVNGVYFFSFYGMNNNGGTFWLQLQKNNADMGINPYVVSSGQYDGNHGSVILELVANDQIKIVSPSTTTLYAEGNAHNGFSGYLIG